MAINAQLIAEELISYSVVTDKSSLVKLLQRNGIQMPNNPSDKEVTVAVLSASAKSPNFKKELATFLTNKVPEAAKDYSSFVGDASDFGFTGIDDFVGVNGFNVGAALGGALTSSGGTTAQKPNTSALTATKKPSAAELRRASRVTADNPQGKTGVGLFLQNLTKSLTSQDTINAGLNIGLTAINNKVQSKSNALQNETVLLTQQQDELRQQLPVTKTGMSTTTWVFIGLGVVALGATIYFVAKKK